MKMTCKNELGMVLLNTSFLLNQIADPKSWYKLKLENHLKGHYTTTPRLTMDDLTLKTATATI